MLCGIQKVAVQDHRDHSRVRHQLVKQFQSLRLQFAGQEADASDVPAGAVEAATRPNSTGSPALTKTIGIIAVAALAALAAAPPPPAKIMVTRRSTRSAAKNLNRSYSLPAQRCSIATFLPSA